MASLDLFKGVGLWTVAMVMPVLMLYIPNATFRIIMLTLIYPTVLSYFCRFGHFWVSHGVLLISCAVTLIFAWAVKQSPDADAAIGSDPQKNKAITGAVMGSILLVFLTTMFVTAKWGVSMYDVSEFNANGANSGNSPY